MQCTTVSSDMTVCGISLPATLTVCSHSAKSVTDPFLIRRAHAFSDCCCRPAAAIRPLLYRSEHFCVSSLGFTKGVLLLARLSGACTTRACYRHKSTLYTFVAPTMTDTAKLGHSWLSWVFWPSSCNVNLLFDDGKEMLMFAYVSHFTQYSQSELPGLL